MTAGERVDVLLDRLCETKAARLWHDLRHEHTLRIRRLVLTTDRRLTAVQMNAFQLGRDIQHHFDTEAVQARTTSQGGAR